MSRQDIHVNATYGEVNITDNLTNKVFYLFQLVDDVSDMDNTQYCFAEIAVPPDFEQRYKDNNGIHINIPYYPIFKEVYIRFRIDSGDGGIEYLINKTNNRQWFYVYRMKDGYAESIKLSEFRLFNENGNYNLILKDGCLVLHSGNETDFIIKASLKQNEIFLLKAFAGNLYQYPTTGVGLIEYLHGNFENAGLAAKLQQEFENDNMVIVNAYMNSENGELHMEVREKGTEDEIIEDDGQI